MVGMACEGIVRGMMPLASGKWLATVTVCGSADAWLGLMLASWQLPLHSAALHWHATGLHSAYLPGIHDTHPCD
jgi:hypothetical protein